MTPLHASLPAHGLLSPLTQPPRPSPPPPRTPRRCSELHSAVRRAYLGPKLSAEELGAGWLPEAFEADERATSDCPDLLQLVSGRQVLGAVRERRAELLARAAAAAAGELGEEGEGRAAAVPAALPAGAVEPAIKDCSAATERQARQQQVLECCLPQHQQVAEQEEQQQQQHAQQQEQQGWQGWQREQREQQAQREPDILDLHVGGQLVATAVRHFPRDRGRQNGGSDPSGSSSRDGSSSGNTGAPDASAGNSRHPGQQAAPAEVIAIYAGGAGGQLLAQVEAQQLDPGSATASSARLLDAQGRHTHTVFRTQTPLVR